GRSFYVMDNINVLRQIANDTTNEPLVVFKPAAEMRSMSRGVTVDCYLKQPADKGTIEFLDAQGKVVKPFTGTPPPAAPPAPAAGAAPPPPPDDTFRPPPPQPAVKQGLSRFVWDMRYPDAKDFKGLIMWAGGVRGPAAPP